MNTETRALSGRMVDDLTLDAVRVGEVGLADLRIHPETLERQAVIAQQHGNPQLAANLRRAAELTGLPDEEVLAIYEALRPGRSSAAELTALARSLAARGLPRNAALVAEAAEVYGRRRLVRAAATSSLPPQPPAIAHPEPGPPSPPPANSR